MRFATVPAMRKWSPLIVLLAGLAVYANSLQGAFIFDDTPWIVENERIRQLWPPAAVLGGTARPVVQVSLALNYAVGGLNVTGYHMVNVAIHLAVALVLLGLVRRCSTDGVGLAVALSWVVHPLASQPVNYIIQRGESLAALFTLLTLYGMVTGRWGLAVVSCALGMASKPVMAIVPVLAFLFDRAFLAGSWRDRRGFYVGLAATWLLLPVLLWNGKAEWFGSAGMKVGAASPWQYLLTQPVVLVHYLRLVVWPDALCLDYGWPVGGNVLATLGVVGAVGVAVWAGWRRPAVGFPGIAVLLLLAPTSSVLPIEDLAFDHRMYLPLAGLIVLAVLGWRRYLGEHRLVLVVVVMALGIRTGVRNLDYSTSETIWADAVQKRPGNSRAHVNLGQALIARGDVAGALAHYRMALQLNPKDADAHYNYGILLAWQQNDAEALVELGRAVKLTPGNAAARYNLGLVLVKLGRDAEALTQLREAVRLKPRHGRARGDFGALLAKNGEFAEAITELTVAVRLDPENSDVRRNLARALLVTGQTNAAWKVLQP